MPHGSVQVQTLGDGIDDQSLHLRPPEHHLFVADPEHGEPSQSQHGIVGDIARALTTCVVGAVDLQHLPLTNDGIDVMSVQPGLADDPHPESPQRQPHVCLQPGVSEGGGLREQRPHGPVEGQPFEHGSIDELLIRTSLPSDTAQATRCLLTPCSKRARGANNAIVGGEDLSKHGLSLDDVPPPKARIHKIVDNSPRPSRNLPCERGS